MHLFKTFLGVAIIIGGTMLGFGEQNPIRKLPLPEIESAPSLHNLISKRRSIRSFKSTSLSEAQISEILYAAQGITEKSYGLRSAPSAGATYPLEIYVVNSEGVWHYLPHAHSIELIRPGDIRPKLCQAALTQKAILEAPVTIVISAVFERTTQRYGNRGIRYVHIEVGHVAQNIHLMSVALGLGSVPIGAFDDEDVAQILNIPKSEKVLYLIPIGYPK